MSTRSQRVESENDKADSGRSPVEELAEIYLERLRRGEKPALSEYTKAHPELAEEILVVFPTLALLEDLIPRQEALEAGRRSLSVGGIPRQLGEYRLIREIGRGGMGIVFEAEHVNMRRRVALKVLPKSSAEQGSNLERFLRESRAAGRLHHSNIVPVFEAGEHEGTYFYAMQYIRGQNLDLVLEELRKLRGISNENQGLTSTETQKRLAASCDLGRSVAHGFLSGQVERCSLADRAANDCPDDTSREIVANNDGKKTAGHTSEELLALELPEPSRPASPARRKLSASSMIPIHFSSSNGGYFSRVARVGLQVAEALSYAHSHGVLHRDIKPSNLLLDTEGVIWITDFGLAKHEGDDFTHTGDVVGTLRYMAPERFMGRADARSDLYSLGLTLYELATLRYAFDFKDRAQLLRELRSARAERPRAIDPKIPRDLETIIIKTMEHDPNRRYQTAEELAEDLRRFLADRPILARRPSVGERVWRLCRRNPLVSILWSCIALLALTVFVGSLWFAYRSQKQANALWKENLRVIEAELQARSAQRDATERLYEAYVGRSLAELVSGRPGRRYETLSLLSQASAILPEIAASEESRLDKQLTLRNRFVTASTLFDWKEKKSWTNADRLTPIMAFPPSYDRFAVSNADGTVTIKRTEDDAQIAKLPKQPARCWSMIFSNNGRYLYCKYVDPQTPVGGPWHHVWDLNTLKPAISFGEDDSIASTAISPDSRLFAVGFYTRQVKIYDLASGRLVAERSVGDAPSSLVFIPNSDQLAIGSEHLPGIELWDFVLDRRERIDTPESISVIAVSDSSERLAGGAMESGTIYLWDLAERSRSPRIFRGHVGRVVYLHFTHSEEILASAAWDTTTRFWDIKTEQQVLRMDGVSLKANGFRSDDRAIALIGPGPKFSIGEVPGKGPVRFLQGDHQVQERWMVRFHPRHHNLIATATKQGAELWDIATGTLLQTLAVGRCRTVLFSPDGGSLFAGGEAGIVRWKLLISPVGNTLAVRAENREVVLVDSVYRFDLDAACNKLIALFDSTVARVIDLSGKKPPVTMTGQNIMDRVLLSPDGKWAATSTWHGAGIWIWNAETGKLLRDLDPKSGSATIAFSPDGQLFAASTGEKQYVWRTADWSKVFEIDRENQDGWPGPVAFSRDSKTLAMAYTRFIPKLMDPLTGKTLVVLDATDHASLGWYDFSGDGTHLAVSATKVIQIWNLADLRNQLAALQLDWQDP